ncbi:DUF2244 domain-containing protein [Paragemmobacter straminiformis]|uniref:DUF2244 domain-containing protein n=1 Tax=Paragemmobacter straminiformis TaxID=2045119 RepID=A0A842ICX2_9RHOB|nr:DUF2244 domain-containing protein [Gemmobacter straminiformis]MBC2837660.1 DUF2244 domain-containing protein [Gemmobacter straminiformis]
MPYEWLPASNGTPARLHLWPYRSLPRRGFVGFIAATCALILVPMLSVIGSPVLWGLLPFFILAVGGIWVALSKSYRDAEIVEDLTFHSDTLTLTRHGPKGKRQDWQANPHWVRLTLHPSGGPVPNYLTLKGNGREVELGAFLTEDERLALRPELQKALDALR